VIPVTQAGIRQLALCAIWSSKTAEACEGEFTKAFASFARSPLQDKKPHPFSLLCLCVMSQMSKLKIVLRRDALTVHSCSHIARSSLHAKLLAAKRKSEEQLETSAAPQKKLKAAENDRHPPALSPPASPPSSPSAGDVAGREDAEGGCAQEDEVTCKYCFKIFKPNGIAVHLRKSKVSPCRIMD
jgi:hypothetical protein